jgi:5-methylthioadenosine/S-adenosylhomocysteine deaminase
MLIRGGRVVTGSAGERRWDPADVLIEGDRIAAIGLDLEPPANTEIIEASGDIVMPGLINAHLHSNEAFEPGAYDNLPLELWLLKSYSPFGFPLRDGREHYLRTMSCAIQSIRAGVTTVQDDLIYPPSTVEAVDQAMRAYRDAGLRAWVTTDMWNRPFRECLPFVDEIVPSDIMAELDALPALSDDELIDLYKTHARNWRGHDGRLDIILAPCGAQRCTEDLLLRIAELSAADDVPIHSHTLETKLQAVHSKLLHNKTLVEYMDGLGLLGPRTTLVHAIWLTPSDIEVLADRGCSVVHNPLSNLKLGSGLAPLRRLMDAGVNIGLGTDGLCSSDTADLVEAIKCASLIHKIGEPDYKQWISADEVFDMATVGGARTGLHQGQLGVLAEGTKADIIVLDGGHWGLVPLIDPVRQLAFSANAGAVRTSIVNGRLVMRERKILTVDEEALKVEIRECAERFWQDGVPGMWEGAERLRPYIEAIYRRAQEHDVPVASEPRRGPPRLH